MCGLAVSETQVHCFSLAVQYLYAYTLWSAGGSGANMLLVSEGLPAFQTGVWESLCNLKTCLHGQVLGRELHLFSSPGILFFPLFSLLLFYSASPHPLLRHIPADLTFCFVKHAHTHWFLESSKIFYERDRVRLNICHLRMRKQRPREVPDRLPLSFLQYPYRTWKPIAEVFLVDRSREIYCATGAPHSLWNQRKSCQSNKLQRRLFTVVDSGALWVLRVPPLKRWEAKGLTPWNTHLYQVGVDPSLCLLRKEATRVPDSGLRWLDRATEN